MDAGDWRTQLPPDSRQKMINKISETLEKHIPFSGPDGTNELTRIAAKCEKKIFSSAVSQTDYLRKISMKMLTMETKSQNTIDASSTIPAANNGTSMDSRILMDNNNWRPSLPNGEPTMDAGDWRTLLPPDSRQKMINKIMQTLKKHIPFSGPDETNELTRMAAKCEEKIFSSAVNQTDYLRKISMKMLTMETKSQNTVGASSTIPAANNGTSMDSTPINQGHLLTGSLPTNQSQASQPLLFQTMQNYNTSGMIGSTALPSSMPAVSSITNNNVTSVVNQSSNMQNVAGMLQDSSGQHGLSSNIFSGSQRQILGRPHAMSSQQQQQPKSARYLYQQQLQQQLLNQNFQPGNVPNPNWLLPPQMQQQQQNVLQPTQLHSSQQPGVPTSATQPSAVNSASLQQGSPQLSAQQTTESMLRQHQSSLLWAHPQSQQTSAIHQQQTSFPQQSISPLQQQQTQMMRQQVANSSGFQQKQMMGQNVVGVMQLQHQQRLLNQQNNMMNIQQQQSQQQKQQPPAQQQLMSQQSSLQATHQQSLGTQSNVAGLQQPQQQMLNSQVGNSTLQNSQVHILSQPTVGLQRTPQAGHGVFSSQGQQSQNQAPQQQMMPQIQSHHQQPMSKTGLPKPPDNPKGQSEDPAQPKLKPLDWGLRSSTVWDQIDGGSLKHWRDIYYMRQEYSSTLVREHISDESSSGNTITAVQRKSNQNLECKAFDSFLNSRGLTLSGCRATDIIDFLSMQKNIDDSNALVCRLSAACERCGVKPKDNPFRSLAVIRYLQLLRKISGKTEGIVFSCDDYDKLDSDEANLIKRILEVLHVKNFSSLTFNLSRESLDMEMFYRCSVGILVLTKQFARNSHSLDHLVTIMERQKANDLVVIPAYCGVTLSQILRSVEQQYLNYFEADKVPKWKAAIAELAPIDGHQIDRYGDMCQLSNAVNLACSRIYLKDTKNLVRILALLDQPQPPDAAEFEGVWGMPGIGKTAIAKEIFEILSPQYDLCYFLQDFHLICTTKGLWQIRDDFFSKVFGEEKPSIVSCDMKPSFLREWFHNKSILVVLDDVSNARDAEYVVGGFDWFSRGHKIILTSRRKQVLVQCKVNNPYKMQSLDEFESIRLFKACYVEENALPLPLVSVMNYSSGNPLAIKVMCESAVWSYWDFHKLRMHAPTEIEKTFRRSYDGLDENEKNIFLDLTCFFQGENKDHVVQLLDACGFLTCLGISDLVDESLISLVDNKIAVPILFQQFGRFIVRDEDKDPSRHSRLWDTNDIKDVLTKNSATEAIEGIFLDVPDLTLDWEVSPTVFGKMNRLRLLKMYCSTDGIQCKLSLPQGLDTLPYELRLLHWENYPLKYLPQEFNPENLVELNMPYSNLEKLWEAKKNLERLKKINLSHSRNLIDIEMLSEALNLEHIDLEGCTSLVDVSTSVPHSGKLISLNMKDSSHLKSLPAMCELTSLKLLNLSGCTDFEEIQDFAPNLKELYLAGTAVRKLPLSVVHLTELGMLDLEDCRRLQQLPPGIKNLRSNLKLKLSGCISLELGKQKSVDTDWFPVQEKGKSRKEEKEKKRTRETKQKGNEATKRSRLKEYHEEDKEEKAQPQKTEDENWKSTIKFSVKKDWYPTTKSKEEKIIKDEEKHPQKTEDATLDSTIKFPAKEDWTKIKEEKTTKDEDEVPEWLGLRL